MLSFIYRLACAFEQTHGHRPNVLYLNPAHFRHLREELIEIPDLDGLTRLLGMEVVLDPALPHPRVCWSPIDWRHAIAV